MLGYFYPALASAKTVVQQDPTAFTQWMTYWWVFGIVIGIESWVLVWFCGVLLATLPDLMIWYGRSLVPVLLLCPALCVDC